MLVVLQLPDGPSDWVLGSEWMAVSPKLSGKLWMRGPFPTFPPPAHPPPYYDYEVLLDETQEFKMKHKLPLGFGIGRG